MKNKRSRKKRHASEGYAYLFHGSFRDKDKAQRKARSRDGFVISRVPRGTSKRRYIVLSGRGPF
jgi:hypothetical protein